MFEILILSENSYNINDKINALVNYLFKQRKQIWYKIEKVNIKWKQIINIFSSRQIFNIVFKQLFLGTNLLFFEEKGNSCYFINFLNFWKSLYSLIFRQIYINVFFTDNENEFSIKSFKLYFS